MTDTRKIELISPWAVPIPANLPARDVKYQAERLQKEGQIEPVELTKRGLLHPDGWVHAPAQIQAARNLGWETILITR